MQNETQLNQIQSLLAEMQMQLQHLANNSASAQPNTQVLGQLMESGLAVYKASLEMKLSNEIAAQSVVRSEVSGMRSVEDVTCNSEDGIQDNVRFQMSDVITDASADEEINAPVAVEEVQEFIVPAPEPIQYFSLDTTEVLGLRSEVFPSALSTPSTGSGISSSINSGSGIEEDSTGNMEEVIGNSEPRTQEDVSPSTGSGILQMSDVIVQDAIGNMEEVIGNSEPRTHEDVSPSTGSGILQISDVITEVSVVEEEVIGNVEPRIEATSVIIEDIIVPVNEIPAPVGIAPNVDAVANNGFNPSNNNGSSRLNRYKSMFVPVEANNESPSVENIAQNVVVATVEPVIIESTPVAEVITVEVTAPIAVVEKEVIAEVQQLEAPQVEAKVEMPIEAEKSKFTFNRILNILNHSSSTPTVSEAHEQENAGYTSINDRFNKPIETINSSNSNDLDEVPSFYKLKWSNKKKTEVEPTPEAPRNIEDFNAEDQKKSLRVSRVIIPDPEIEASVATLADKYKDIPTLYDKLSGAQGSVDQTVAYKLKKKPISDLKSAIGINEQFLMVSEIFRGNKEDYYAFIDFVNCSCDTYEEALAFVQSARPRLNWNQRSAIVADLMELIERRFL